MLAIVIAGLWQIEIPQKVLPNNPMPAKSKVAQMKIQTEHISYICDDRKYCSQMTTYEEAVFFNKNCPNTKMDVDKDGYSCERQFGN